MNSNQNWAIAIRHHEQVLRVFALLLIAIVSILGCVRPSSAAQEVTFDAGRCAYQVTKGAVFREDGMPENNYARPACFALSYSNKFNGSDTYGFRIGYHSFGNIEGRGNVAYILDDDIALATRGLPISPCQPASTTGRGCLATFDSIGSADGFNFSLTGEKRIGAFAMVGEAGVLIYETQTYATAKPLDPTSCAYQCNGWTASYYEHSGFFNRPAPMLGFSLRYGNFSISYRRWFFINEHRELTMFFGNLEQATVGYSIPF